MPYILAARRLAHNDDPNERIDGPGELNYLITELIQRYIRDVRDVYGRVGYQHYNDVIGALEGAKLEFYRRVVSKYEDGKIIENGAVYGS
jgi:hypothetical protein